MKNAMTSTNSTSSRCVSVITVNFNQSYLTCLTIDSIKKSNYENLEIIVVDNGSEKDDADLIKENHPEVTIIKSNKNLGFAGGNNLGVQHAKGEYIFFLNNDTEIQSDTISKLVSKLQSDHTIGAVSPKIRYYFSPAIIQYAGSTPLNPITMSNKHIGNGEADQGQHNTERETAYIHGAAVMIPKSVMEKVGLMPECFFLYYEELDYSETIKKHGFKIVYLPETMVYHKESMSTGKSSVLKTYYLSRNRLLFAKRNLKGMRYKLFMIYFFLLAAPKNTLSYLFDLKKLQAFYMAILWNISEGKYDYKPFKI